MRRNLNSKNYEGIEKAHYRNQEGMYFSGRKVIPGAILMFSDLIEDYFWNYATLINTKNDELNNLIRQIKFEYKKNNRVPSLYISPSTKPVDLEDVLIRKNFEMSFQDVWMLYGHNEAVVNEINGFEVIKVDTIKRINTFLEIFYNVYGGASEDEPYGELPKSYGDCILRSYNNPPNDLKISHYIGEYKSSPVSIGSLISSNNFGGIYNIGTIPEYRDKGFGSSISMEIVKRSIGIGNNKTYLMTEKDSYVEKFYKAMGFKEIFIGKNYILGI